MKFLISLAWKNLSRYKKRTMITACALAFGIALYIFTDSLLSGADMDSQRNLVWYETSSARIMDRDYWENRDQTPLNLLLEHPGVFEGVLEEMKIPSAPRTVFAGELVVYRDPFEEDGSMQVRIYGIDPDKDDAVFKFRELIAAGRYLQKGDNGILIGSSLARNIGAEVGYPVRITTRTRYGQHQVIDLDVIGIIDCPNPVIDKKAILMPLDTVDLYLEMEGAVTEINMKFPEIKDTEALGRALKAELLPDFPGIDVLDWTVLGKDAIAMSQAKQAGSGMILFLLFVIAAVGVSNTMLMSIFERVRELGMMRALGMKTSQIRTAFLIEAAGIGIIGSGIGVAIGCLLNIWAVGKGIDLNVWMRGMDMDIGYRIRDVFRGAWNPTAIIQAFFIGILITVIVALIPTRRALNMSITECLRDK